MEVSRSGSWEMQADYLTKEASSWQDSWEQKSKLRNGASLNHKLANGVEKARFQVQNTMEKAAPGVFR